MQYVGKLDRELLKAEFGELMSDNVVLTIERENHIREKHASDFVLLQGYGKSVVEKPDVILKDEKNTNTAFFIKQIKDTNLNIVIKLAMVGDEKHPENSIMTAYRIRDKNLRKLEKKNKTLYKSV